MESARHITGEQEVLAANDDPAPTVLQWLGSWVLTGLLLLGVAGAIVLAHAVIHQGECQAAVAAKGK